MDLGLKNKVAIVTGASGGLGRGIALGLAGEGVRVILNSRNKDLLEKAADEIQNETGSEIHPVPGDVTDPDTGGKLVSAAMEKFNKIDILINNAGGPPSGNFDKFSVEDFQAAFELNCLSAMRITKEVLPFMKKQKSGRIINCVSAGIKVTNSTLVLSSVSRCGVMGWSKNLASDMAPYNILVNMVIPGFIMTDRLLEVAKVNAQREGKSEEEILEGMKKKVPLGRLGTPEDFANAVVFLVSEPAQYITGVALQIDGGRLQTLI